MSSSIRVGVVGCCHGELDAMYQCVEDIQRKKNIKLDLLLITGDFQAVRNKKDMESMAVPAKYAEMKHFWKYYVGRSKAPILTLVIGGNHESSNYMSELPYGGWLAPNIYYLGRANVVSFRGLRIAGLSGIFNRQDFMRGHYEYPPFDRNMQRSIYHVRNLEVFRLRQLRQGRPIDIFLSHDWPQGIYRCGNEEELLKRKPYLRGDVVSGRLGNPHSAQLLIDLKPRYWFSSHHHCKFAAKVQHANCKGRVTNFLALDKCLPGRQFIQVLDITPECQPLFGNSLCLDPEWLSILKSTDHLLSTSPGNVYMPGPGTKLERYDFKPTNDELCAILQDFHGLFSVPSAANSFRHTSLVSSGHAPYRPFCNPQTTLICQMLDIRDPVQLICRQQNVLMEHPAELEDGEIYDEELQEEPASADRAEGGEAIKGSAKLHHTPFMNELPPTDPNSTNCAFQDTPKSHCSSPSVSDSSPLGDCIQLPPALATPTMSTSVRQCLARPNQLAKPSKPGNCQNNPRTTTSSFGASAGHLSPTLTVLPKDSFATNVYPSAMATRASPRPDQQRVFPPRTVTATPVIRCGPQRAGTAIVDPHRMPLRNSPYYRFCPQGPPIGYKQELLVRQPSHLRAPMIERRRTIDYMHKSNIDYNRAASPCPTPRFRPRYVGNAVLWNPANLGHFAGLSPFNSKNSANYRVTRG